MARDLGGASSGCSPAMKARTPRTQAQWKMIVDALRECARRAAEFGVTIGVQNHHDIACGFESL